MRNPVSHTEQVVTPGISMLSDRHRAPTGSEIILSLIAFLFLVLNDVHMLFAIVFLLFLGYVTLRVPTLKEGERIEACKHAMQLKNYKIDSDGRVRIGLTHLLITQFPLINWLLGYVHYGILYSTNRGVIFHKFGYLMSKGPSIYVDRINVKEVHLPDFVGGMNVQDEIVRLSRGRINPDVAETILDFSEFVPNSSMALMPLTTFPRVVFLFAKMTGMGLAAVVDNQDNYLFWLHKPVWVLEHILGSANNTVR
jgi:hypothetical protein